MTQGSQPAHSDNLDVWDGGGSREAREGGDICTSIADSHCCRAETNTTL